MNKRYLPIGSVVRLKNRDKEIMITGYYSVEYSSDLEIYDYSGCIYPEGLMIKSGSCSFNERDISEILFKGYETEEYKKLTNGLNEIDDEVLNIDNKNIELDKIEEFSFPHYKFDKDGIIIEK